MKLKNPYSLLPYFLNADSFLTLRVSDLSFRKGEEPPVGIDNTTPYALKYSVRPQDLHSQQPPLFKN